jgi:hypothetical protein
MIADTHATKLNPPHIAERKKRAGIALGNGDQKYCAFRLAHLVVLGTICAILAGKANSGTMFFLLFVLSINRN